MRHQIFDHFSALADGTRSRILLVLGLHELTVSELCSVLQLPQSTVSRHLKILADGDWIRQRKDGTRRVYSLRADELDPAAERLWSLTREQVGGTPGAREDARRLEGLLEQRRTRSQEFFSSAAGRWDRLRDEMFGARFSPLCLLGLLDPAWVVADLGCGTGPVAEVLAGFVGRVIAVDGSASMLDAARQRLASRSNVELRQGQLEALPIDDAQLDAATLILVLHHLPDPGRALSEVNRVLKPGGRLLLVDMLPHDRQEYQQEMGHVWMGFSRAQIQRLCAAASLRPAGFRALPPDAEARGPGLFVATATHVELTAAAGRDARALRSLEQGT